MKLATLKRGGRDGTLMVVSTDLARSVAVPNIAPTLQAALEDWEQTFPRLAAVSQQLNAGQAAGAEPFHPEDAASPLPRAYQWADSSVYLNHMELVRKARGGEMPASFLTDPLMYQGGSDGFLGPRDAIPAASEEWGVDFEAEIAIVTDDVPMGIGAEAASPHIKLLMLVNDVSLRNLIPGELAKSFGFFHGKPASAFSPVAVTPDELGAAWDGAKLHLPLVTHFNGSWFGNPDAGVDMYFDFPALIAHAAKTRHLGAGAIIGSGTVSNRERSKGSTCIAERRALERLESGSPVTPFMRYGDRVRIEMFDQEGHSIFGAIEQEMVPYHPPGQL